MTQPDSGPGLDFEILANLNASLSGLAAELRRSNDRADRLQEMARSAQYIDHIPLGQITVSGAAGVLDVPNLMGPRTGYFWDVHRYTCSAFTGGTVSVYNGGVADGQQVMVFTSAGVSLVGKAQGIVSPGNRLIAQAAGLSGTATLGIGVTIIRAEYFWDYLL